MRDTGKISCTRGRRLRLGLYLAALATVSTVIVAQKADAELSERALSIGRQLDRLSALAAGTTTLTLNGARMALTTVTREESVGVLLDRFAVLCGRDSGGVSEQLDALGERVPPSLRRGAFGVFRTQQDDEGSAACFARGGGGGLEETIRRLGMVVDSGDFAALGQLRYVFARKVDDGLTHVISVSSLGALQLDAMFPDRGDAPGADLVFDVRPDGARRILSASVEGSKLQTAMYESTLAPERALAGYESRMRELGFVRGNLDAVSEQLVASTRLYLRADETVLVLARPRGERSSVSSFRLQNGGFVSVPLP